MLKLLAQGRTGKEISVELGISDGTVRTTIRRILTKLGVHSRLGPPPRPPAASAALAVPLQRAEDIPRHVGQPLHRKSGSQ